MSLGIETNGSLVRRGTIALMLSRSHFYAKNVQGECKKASLFVFFADIEHIEKALQEWASSGGFRDPGVTLASLSHQLHILRSDLTYYFEQHLQRTFRVWLSDIRFQEVQRMMIQYPDYNNDAISSECGFSSRAHLYRIFKQKTGMTPGEWKASGSYQALGDTDTR